MSKRILSALLVALMITMAGCGKETDSPVVVTGENMNETTSTEEKSDNQDDIIANLPVNTTEEFELLLNGEAVKTEEVIMEEMQLLLTNLNLEEYLSEAINQVTNPKWYEVLLPENEKDNLIYSLLVNGQERMTVEVGYVDSEKEFCKIEHMADGSQIQLLELFDDQLRYVLTTKGENGYEDDFVAWNLDGATGDIVKESGTLVDNYYTGEYEAQVREGKGASELYTLWSHRDGMKYTRYTGNFDEANQKILFSGMLDVQTKNAYTNRVSDRWKLMGEKISLQKDSQSSAEGNTIAPTENGGNTSGATTATSDSNASSTEENNGADNNNNQNNSGENNNGGTGNNGGSNVDNSNTGNGSDVIVEFPSDWF